MACKKQMGGSTAVVPKKKPSQATVKTTGSKKPAVAKKIVKKVAKAIK